MALPTIHGLPACSCLAAWLPVFEAAIDRSPRWFQLVGDAPASAGFHRGGGSADSEPLSEDELRIARNMGAAAWNRWWTDSDGDPNYHAHMRLNGCPHNSIGQPQVADLNAGRDGTGPLYDNAGAPDDGPRDGVLWPLRTWREGIAWAEKEMDPMADPKIQAQLDRIEELAKRAATGAANEAKRDKNERERAAKRFERLIRLGLEQKKSVEAIAYELANEDS